MSNQIISITDFKTGFDTYNQPENAPNDAFPRLDNAHIFRGVLQKRKGNELLGTVGDGNPIQGLCLRQTVGFLKDLIAFSTEHAYLYNTATNVFDDISGGTTWTGTNTDFFWCLNYQSSFFSTNNVDPIRYNFSGSTWTDFTPFINGNIFRNENLGTIAGGAASLPSTPVANIPVLPNTVVVTIAPGAGQPQVTLSDNGSGILVSSTGGYSGTVNYTTGAIALSVIADANDRDVTVSYSQEGTTLQTALLIFAYKDRMVALNTTEGGRSFRQRARYSQNGSVYVTAPVPTGFTFNANAWREDIPGRGGFIDAPTDEAIVTAGFVRDVLVVLFEFSAWRLRYTGNDSVPFVWERLHSQLGAESTYSVIGFDSGILSVGRAGVTITDTNQQKRIDEIIPDQVYQISNVSNAQKRVHGIRDFQRQLCYWTYPSPDSTTFPDKVLVYNYVENNWATYTQSFTAFGEFRRDDALIWEEATQTWEEEDSLWAAGDMSSGFPSVVAGDESGNVYRLDPTFSSDNGTGYNFNILTKKFNPWIEQGLQVKAIYMYLLISGTSEGEITIEHFIDEGNNGIPIATYTVSTNTSLQEKVWRRIPLSAATAQYHQFQFTLSSEQASDNSISTKDVEIYQLLLEMAPSGRLTYGDQ